MQRYALRSAVAKPGVSVSVTPRRRALSESSLPFLSPEALLRPVYRLSLSVLSEKVARRVHLVTRKGLPVR